MTTRIITDSNGRKHITNEPLLHPPKKEWVGLTDEEWLLLGCKSVEEVRIGLAIQAKLKEKNT